MSRSVLARSVTKIVQTRNLQFSQKAYCSSTSQRFENNSFSRRCQFPFRKGIIVRNFSISKTVSMPIETVVECATPTIGEGPHWDDATQSLLWVDIIDGILFRWDSKTGKHETHKFDTSVSFVVPCQKGGYLVGLGKTVSHFDWETKKITKLASVDEGKNTRMNPFLYLMNILSSLND